MAGLMPGAVDGWLGVRQITGGGGGGGGCQNGKSAFIDFLPILPNTSLKITTTFPIAFAAIPKVLATLDLGPGNGPGPPDFVCPAPVWYLVDVTPTSFGFVIFNASPASLAIAGAFIHWEACPDFVTPEITDQVFACAPA